MVKLSDYKLPVKLPDRNYPHTQMARLPMKINNSSSRVSDTDNDGV